VIILNNNVKILLVSLMHYTELQNFLNDPRMIVCLLKVVKVVSPIKRAELVDT